MSSRLTAITLGTVEDSINRNLKRWGIRCERRGRLFYAFCQDAQAKGLVARPVHALGAGKDGVEHRDFVWGEGQVITSLFMDRSPPPTTSKNYTLPQPPREYLGTRMSYTISVHERHIVTGPISAVWNAKKKAAGRTAAPWRGSLAVARPRTSSCSLAFARRDSRAGSGWDVRGLQNGRAAVFPPLSG